MTLPKNLHIVDARRETPTEKVRAALGSAAWLDSPDAWDMDQFIAEIDLAMVEAYGDTLSIGQHFDTSPQTVSRSGTENA